MGRKRSEKEDARNQPTPKVSKPAKTGTTGVTCPKCQCRVMQSNATGDILRHYKGDGATVCE